MFKLTNIKKTFKDKKNIVSALDGVTFEIKSGEIFGIIGKSGVGKSTLLKILSFQSTYDEGEFIFLDKDTKNLTHHEQRQLLLETSYIHQSFSLLYNLSVLENIALPLILRGISKKEALEKSKKMLSYVGLIHKEKEYPITLSGGEAQRISIARALVTQPKVIYADEPTSSLDDATAYEILSLLKQINQEFKTTIIFVSHQTELVKYLCDRVLLLEKGKIKRLAEVKNTKELVTDYESIIWGDENV
ncbi:ABC transporter ATP-binding protein [Acholeplasma hippikon]|nr:ABC transporter ATP-binding protein [Acholeplasma hippikon]